MTPNQIQWLTWGAIQHRPAGSPRWDEPGTAKAIADHCGTWSLAVATEHVLAHARDPKARTPFAIKGNPPHTEPSKAVRRPAKVGDECPMHPGEYVGSCRACAADRLAGDESVVPHRHKPEPGVSARGADACRAAAGLQSSPAPDAATSVEPPAPPAASSADEGDDHRPASAGEPCTYRMHAPGDTCDCAARLAAVTTHVRTSTPQGPDFCEPCSSAISEWVQWPCPAARDDRPEAACLADGCYRPTRDGICDRCRAAGVAEAEQAANRELIDRLNANERARAHTRPEPEPGPPRHFTSADINHDRVRAAMTQAATPRSTE